MSSGRFTDVIEEQYEPFDTLTTSYSKKYIDAALDEFGRDRVPENIDINDINSIRSYKPIRDLAEQIYLKEEIALFEDVETDVKDKIQWMQETVSEIMREGGNPVERRIILDDTRIELEYTTEMLAFLKKKLGDVSGGAESDGFEETPGRPVNRLNRRTEVPSDIRRGLASGARMDAVPNIGDSANAEIKRRFAGSKLKAKPMGKNLEYTPGSEWLLDGKKFLSLFKNENGEQMSNEEIARLIDTTPASVADMALEGNGIPEADFRKLAEALFITSPLNRRRTGGRASDADLASALYGGPDEGGSTVSGVNLYSYPDIVGTMIWGFDYAPYWFDQFEGTNLSRLGKSTENYEKDRTAFNNALGDGEVLRTIVPAFEPVDFVDDGFTETTPIAVTPKAEVADTPTPVGVERGNLVPQGQVLERSNFEYRKLIEYLGGDPDNQIDSAQKLIDAGVDIANARSLYNWVSAGVPSEAIENLIDAGSIPSAAAVFGPEVGEFDRMPKRHDVYSAVLSALAENNIPEKRLSYILGGSMSTSKIKALIEAGKKKQAAAKAGEKLKASGKATKIDEKEIGAIVARYNSVAESSGAPRITSGQLLGQSRGMSSGGRRFVNNTDTRKMSVAKAEVKYPSMKKAYDSVSDIPTPTRLDRQGMSSGRMDEVYQTLTKSIVEKMEEAIASGSKWEAPWHKGRMLPRNGRTTKSYRGINSLMLMLVQEEKGYEKPVWGSYEQWKKLGGQVRKGEKGTLVVYWNPAGSKKVDDPDRPGEKKDVRTAPVLRESHVFNLDQVDGVDRAQFDFPDSLSEEERVARVDEAVAALGAEIKHVGDRAAFYPNEDVIRMPPFSEFNDAVSYYGTLVHELVHWSGHRDRLDRPNMHKVNSEQEYAFEELIAEIGASYMMSILGLEVEPREDHAQYLGFWVQRLKDDPAAISKAAGEAQKAVNYLIDNIPFLKAENEEMERVAASVNSEDKAAADAARAAKPKTGTKRKPSSTRKR